MLFMEKSLKTLKSNPLFEGVDFVDFEMVINCLEGRLAFYAKDGIILLAGDALDYVGLILSGSVRIIKEDIDGRIAILTELVASDVFGEVFACADVPQSPVTIQAATDTEVLFLDYKRIVTTCTAACPFHTQIIKNMLKLIAVKNMALDQKIEILSKRTTREKLLCFFDMQRGSAHIFTIPFNREELAQYLCVNRSALSNELSKMRDEGLIRFNRNRFEILE